MLLKVTTRFVRFAVPITCLALVVYVVAQQGYRQGLNDPQIELVRDAEQSLLNGVQPPELIKRYQLIDITKSLAPFVAVYDESGNLLESSGVLGAMTTVPPVGVFETAKVAGEHRVSWQPAPSTRIALVVRPVAIESGWFVASGRNMSEIESRVQSLGQLVLLGWLGTLVATFVTLLVLESLGRRA